MAEGLLRAMAGERVQVASAGSAPTSVNPFAIRVLRDKGIDISRQSSTNVSEYAGEAFDYVITLCAEEECPLFPGPAVRLHWELPDPAAVEGSAEDKLVAFRQTAEDLRAKISEFIAYDLQKELGRVR
jgi:arsenate reductase (thioredoxin)